MTIADEVFVATALLHQERPDRRGFRGAQINRRIAKLEGSATLRAGVNAHIYQHCVANRKPSTLRHRILYQLEDGSFRLFRPGDDSHPDRTKGKTLPKVESLPEKYRPLMEWYQAEYTAHGDRQPDVDPVLALRGRGKEMWRELGGDRFIRDLRSNWFGSPGAGDIAEPEFGVVWNQVMKLAGETFHTRRHLPFHYEVEGEHAVRIDREGHRINRQLWRGEFEKAWQRRPLTKTTQIRDLQGPAYIFAILTDRRVAS